MIAAVAFVLATSADVLTWCLFVAPGVAFRELNPVVLALGAAAPSVRLGLAAAAVPLAWSFRRPRLLRYRLAGHAIFAAGILVGLIGAASNIPRW